jgi:zinc protease
VLSIVGDMSLERAQHIANQLLGDLPAAKAAAPRRSRLTARFLRRARAAPQGHQAVGGVRRIPRAEAALGEMQALEVLNGVLTGLGGRLFVELRDKRSLGYMTGSSYNPLFQRGIFFGYANRVPTVSGSGARHPARARPRSRSEPVSDDEISLSKEWLTARM